jgi:hypothetical protein
VVFRQSLQADIPGAKKDHFQGVPH